MVRAPSHVFAGRVFANVLCAQTILAGRPSHKLFLMGTEIIDGHLAVMDQANAVVRDQLYAMNMMMLERLSAEPV